MTTVAIAAGVWLLSSLTLTTGIGGGAAYTPLLVILFGLDVPTAVGTSIVTQLAGVATTAIGHTAGGRSDLGLAARLATTAVGGLMATRVMLRASPTGAFEPAFVVALVGVALWLAVHPHPSQPLLPLDTRSWRRLISTVRDGPVYPFCRPGHGYVLSAVAGSTMGLLGISGAEIQISALMLRCRVPAPIAVGTGTAATTGALAVAAVWVVFQAQVAWPVVAASVPAAILGARTSRVLAAHVPATAMRQGIAAVMLLAAAEIGLRRALL